jgi:CRISPR-associated protein Csd1
LSALASLVRAYDRLFERGEVPAFGYSLEKIGFVVPLNPDGSPAGRRSTFARAKTRKRRRD